MLEPPARVTQGYRFTGERRYPKVDEWYMWLGEGSDGSIVLNQDDVDPEWEEACWDGPPEHFAIYELVNTSTSQ